MLESFKSQIYPASSLYYKYIINIINIIRIISSLAPVLSPHSRIILSLLASPYLRRIYPKRQKKFQKTNRQKKRSFSLENIFLIIRCSCLPLLVDKTSIVIYFSSRKQTDVQTFASTSYCKLIVLYTLDFSSNTCCFRYQIQRIMSQEIDKDD